MAENEAKICEYKDPWTGKACYRPMHDDKRCIFHSKDIDGKKKDFEVAFWAEFERQDKSEENYDFSGFVFSGDISFANQVFEKDAYFGYAQFSKDVFFYEAQLSGNANFWEAQFSGDANFYKAKFTGKAQFGQAQFSRNAYFEYAQFTGDVNFQLSQFSRNAYFKFDQFNGNVNFKYAQFSGKTFFTGIALEYPNLLNMIETYLHDVTGLFEYIEKNRKEFKYPDKTEFLPERIRPILGEKAADLHPIVNRQIQDDKYLIAFKEKYKGWFWVWWALSNCGRSIWPLAMWVMFIVNIFASVYYCLGPDAFAINSALEFSASTMIYYSIVTFSTLGFGDITPLTTCASVAVMTEVIIGYIALGLLISVAANKFARRS